MRKTASKSMPTGWFVAGSNPKAYDMGICEDVCHSGTKCAQIRCADTADDGFGTLMQSFDATNYRGKRVRLSAFVRCKNVSRWSGLWMRIDAGSQMVSFDNMQDRPICGDQDWQSYDIVLNVPDDSTSISFGILLAGAGHVWLDDVQFAVVESDAKTTGALDRSCGVRYQNDLTTNLDFSRGISTDTSDVCLQSTPVGWFNQVSKPGAYTFGLDEHSIATDAADKPCAFIKSTDLAQSNNWGALLQSVDTRSFLGKHARLTGWIKTAEVLGNTGLWLRADAGTRLQVCWDYMEDRMISGTTDWTKYECVIEIPSDSDNIYLGAVLNGIGTVWVKDFELEAVDKSVTTTGAHSSLALVESARRERAARAERAISDAALPQRWLLSGNASADYSVVIDPPLDLDGQKCMMLESRTAAKESFGTLMQTIDAQSFVGKSVQVSANIKTSKAHRVGLWVRVDGSEGEVLAFDNMHRRPIVGTKDWARYEIVLDACDKSRKIAYGVLLCGTGKVWIADVQVDCVETKPNASKKGSGTQRRNEPINLDFES